MDKPITPERLKVELSQPGRSQSALAAYLGLDPSAVNRMVNGRRLMKVREASLIDEYLRATAEGGAVSRSYSIEDSKGPGALIASMQFVAGGATTRDIVLSSYYQVATNIRVMLEPSLAFSTPKSAEQFWGASWEQPEVLALLGLGARLLNTATVEHFRTLARLARSAVAQTDAEFDSNPDLPKAVASLIGEEILAHDPDPDRVRRLLAMSLTRLAMKIAIGDMATWEAIGEAQKALTDPQVD